MSVCSFFGDVCGVSEVQGTLVLVALVVLASVFVMSSVGDSVVSDMLDFGRFRVWGFKNVLSSGSVVPGVTILNPVNGSIVYSDDDVRIWGRCVPFNNESIVMVFYRVNGGNWTKADLNDGDWSGGSKRFSPGVYFVEAVAYDSSGDPSKPVSTTFKSVTRLVPDSVYLSDDIPLRVTAGENYDLHVRYGNSGTTTWSLEEGYCLSPMDPNAVHLPSCYVPSGVSVLPSESTCFSLVLMAPETTGTYEIRLKMRNKDGWFGQELKKNITVVASYYDSRIVAINIPSTMFEGNVYNVSVVMNNKGTASWSRNSWSKSGANPVKLGMVGDYNGDAYRFNKTSIRVEIPEGVIVRTGENITFNFQMTAPSPELYHPQYKMVQETIQWFGEQGGIYIDVVNNPNKPTPTTKPGTTTDPYQSYTATGTMRLMYPNGEIFPGCIEYVYDGPLCSHYTRGSYYESWDIGGPNGHYRIYKDGCSGELQFDMNNGGNKGTVTFRR